MNYLTQGTNNIKRTFFVFLTAAILFSSYSLFAAGSITFKKFGLKQTSERHYIVNADLRFHLTEYLRDSLREGVVIISKIDVSIVKNRPLWWNKKTTLAEIISTLQYHALSEHYQVIRQDTNEHWNFKKLSDALRKMGALEKYRLPKLHSKISNGKYHILLQASIEPDTFKFPMQIHSLFVKKYKIETAGIRWPLP